MGKGKAVEETEGKAGKVYGMNQGIEGKEGRIESVECGTTDA